MLTWDLIKVVNQKFDMVPLLRALGVSVDRIPTTLLCPFHPDTKKSAKLFRDGGLFCWTCHKTYRSYDALQLLGYDDDQIKRKLGQLGPLVLKDTERFEPDMKAAGELRVAYRVGRMDFTSYLDEIYERFLCERPPQD